MSSYRYRPHLRWGRNLIFRLLIGLSTVFLILSAVYGYLWLGILLSGILLGEGLLLKYMINRFIQVEVITNPTSIRYKTHQKDLLIPYTDIITLKFPSATYLGGWIKISSKTDNIRLTVVIENIAAFLQELKRGIDQQGRQQIYDQNKFFRFLKTSAYSDQSWERLYEIFFQLFGGQLLACLVGILLTTVIAPEMTIPGRIFMGLISSLWVIGPYLSGEACFAKRVETQSNFETFTVPPRDKALEARIYKKARLYGLLSYLLVFPIITVLFN